MPKQRVRTRPPAIRTGTKSALPLSETALLDLVERVYDAAMRPEQWTGVLERWTDMLGGNGGVMFAADYTANPPIELGALTRIDPGLTLDYRDHYGTRDVWMKAGARLPAGAAVTGSSLLLEDVLSRSEFYNDFLKRFGIFRMCSVVLSNPDGAGGGGRLSVYRSRSAEDFGPSDLRVARTLAPHLCRAYEIHRRFAAAGALRDAQTEALDRLALGVVLVDSSGAVLVMNRTAADLVAANDGLAVARGALAAARAGETAMLQRLVGEAVRTGIGNGLHAGGAMAISRPSLKQAYSVLVTPLGPNGFAFGDIRPAAAIFVSDPERRPRLRTDVLTRALGLTGAEARIAEALAQGARLEDAAERFGVTVGTARTQLKAAFAKTGARRQADLVRLILTSPATLGTRK